MERAVRPGGRVVSGGDLPVAVLKCLHRGDSKGLASVLLNHRRDLDGAARVLLDERLGVSVHAATESLALGGLWPRSVLARLREQWIGQQRRNAGLLEWLSAIARAFDREGIEYLVLKGLPMAARFQGGVDRRFTWDLDLLVREADVARSLRALAAIGVRSPPLTRRVQWVARRVTHALECRTSDGMSVDLHWAFRRLPGLRFPASEVFQARRFCELDERRYPVPSDEHLLLQVLLGIGADVDRSLCRVRSLWDAYLLLGARPVPDWNDFLARRESEGCLTLVANAIAVVLHRLGVAEEFEDLARAIESCRGNRPLLRPEDAAAILARRPHSPRNHLAFAAWQPRPRWQYWTWWAATLPLRAFFARRL